MSAAFYGCGRAPERACRKIAAWPAEDRRLWEMATTPGDLLEPGGERAAYRAISNRKVEHGYGRWLTFLDASGALNADVPPANRIARPVVAEYVRTLQNYGNSSQTVLSRLQELYEAAVVMDPAADWTWIRRMASRVRAHYVPVRDKVARLVGTDELVELGLQLIAGASAASTARLGAIDFRDGLLIAFLALCPLRLKNVAALELDRHVVRIGNTWRIVIASGQTKNKLPIEGPWPECLTSSLEEWISHWRPLLRGMRHRWTAPVGNALWVSSHGSPMTMQAVYDRVISRTGTAFGISINPHCFRDIAATTDADPVHARVAASVLVHSNVSTTERTYIHAKMMEAVRQHQELILRLRRRSEQTR